ncbi:uncharacterized protein CYBJADRAFT_92958 [Cyberlindnera jadinii NRRL Y-1542]|uniref:Alkyl hydroperoxide reductase subunit C/ Thiol specific antioxidant domain-containing protein n=1 Tax=Cyberlindnera jadinii (strain ATCC 18201 / CBS 1600 / BCRC 20928 / JCM 3617 / NBRC 0987 / NRRL Y-1542) TaxID=983966 RepID=A0A1E4S1L7_CYBJN|nr:hypothetical protein CYBJADRAFT_92958 [Cyberlindnera jadinii NRRL Y-1542]ODV73397.1 hypothetical protein CYBJADRAFT_92958 [Cyberlindnera jadinii NRRL Y-1542]
MKRKYNTMELPPSPESSGYEEEENLVINHNRRKRSRDQRINHDFNDLVEDSLLDFVQRDGETVRRKFRSHGKPLVLVFFGIMNGYLDDINENYESLVKHYDANIIGISSNVSENSYRFPLINSTMAMRNFNVLDPVGGGVYPRDVMFVFDRFGKQKLEIPIKHMNRFVFNESISNVLAEALEHVTNEMVYNY